MNDVALVLDRDFCNGLQHCRGSASAVSQNIKDMYDGLEYLQHCKTRGLFFVNRAIQQISLLP